MSTPARDAYETPEPTPYLQSPVDDMESFFWVALWASLRNKKVVLANLTHEEKRWRRGMRGSTLERTGVASEIGERQFATSRLRFNPILASMWTCLDNGGKSWVKFGLIGTSIGRRFRSRKRLQTIRCTYCISIPSRTKVCWHF